MKGAPIEPEEYADMGGAGAAPHQMQAGFANMGAQIIPRASSSTAQPQSAQPSRKTNSPVPNFL